ncbi:MAG: ABC transporter substrate-binding protein [Micrococcales bacterium]|nr:ABC transporter substrate-binding protein [Micrococcales bacterium]
MRRRRLALTSLATAAVVSLGLSSLAGCSKSDGVADAEDAKYVIGTAVIVEHPALQAVLKGFEEVLEEEGLDYKLINKNAQGEESNVTTIANSFASNSDIDLILAISTPVAKQMANAEKNRPILFSAVTDPVADRLVPSWDEAGPNVTGTSDLHSGGEPVSLIQEAMPDVKTVGVLYSAGESNSAAQLEQYQAEAAELGVTVKPKAITSSAEVTAGLEALADVDAILVPTDNTVVAAIAAVVKFGKEKQIPVFCADNSTVELGTVATRGLSYHDMGRRTGEMAVQILRDGKSVSSIKPEAPESTDLLINLEAAASFGLTLPDSLVSQGTVAETKK